MSAVVRVSWVEKGWNEVVDMVLAWGLFEVVCVLLRLSCVLHRIVLFQMWRYHDMTLGMCAVSARVSCAHTLPDSVEVYSVGQFEAVAAALVALSAASHPCVRYSCCIISWPVCVHASAVTARQWSFQLLSSPGLPGNSCSSWKALPSWGGQNRG